jgi:hypothetical protein
VNWRPAAAALPPQARAWRRAAALPWLAASRLVWPVLTPLFLRDRASEVGQLRGAVMSAACCAVARLAHSIPGRLAV